MFCNTPDFWSNRSEEVEKKAYFLRSIHLEHPHLSQNLEMSEMESDIENYIIL